MAIALVPQKRANIIHLPRSAASINRTSLWSYCPTAR
jgi:hypothetical protein